MGRKKVENKNENISISLKIHQIDYANKNKKHFNLSKFVQLCLQNHIDLEDEIETIQLKGGCKTNGKKTINRR